MSTSLDELPNKGTSNVSLNIDEKPVQASIQQPDNGNNGFNNGDAGQNSTLSQDDINKIISGIQIANQSNLTKLPSKNIPMDQNAIQSDPQTKPNYIPPPKENVDYINNQMTIDQLALIQAKKEKDNKRNDDTYDKLQLPILLFILCFVFQLPFVNKMLFKYIPGLFIRDNSLAFGGYIFKSALFTGIVYLIQKNIEYLSSI